jgi:hypothetical protein
MKGEGHGAIRNASHPCATNAQGWGSHGVFVSAEGWASPQPKFTRKIFVPQ